MNVPTILFWDPERWEARPEAEPYLGELRRVGMLWDTPEEAAAKLTEVYDDPLRWWGSDETQAVRRRFTDRYALARADWVECWARALEHEYALSQNRKSDDAPTELYAGQAHQ